MDSARWHDIEVLFEALTQLPPPERPARLEQAPEDLRAELARLLAADEASGSAIRAAVSDGEATLGEAADFTGGRFGAWRVTGRLGDGGMASVYRVVRDDGLFEQKAALKILQFGRATPEARERFRSERRILAKLEHPGIARLIDGGETAEGQPFLVMELAEGEPVTEFARRKTLPREARLRLFLEVCEAVSHAHQAMIAHRDLKPSNVLVTNDGAVKLVDFGIARLFDAGAEEAAAVALTPQYASPEQVRGGAVSAATDVYSLGLILYELLAGKQAYTVSPGTPLELERFLTDTEPEPPNVSRDLDAILGVALRKDPAKRYRSVAEFAADVNRVLLHEPVSALADSAAYRTWKYLRRNRWSVAGAVLLAASLIGGTLVSSYQARRAERRFAEVRQLTNKFLFEIDSQIAPISGTTKARELLVTTAVTYLDTLAREADGDLELQAELAGAYEKLGDLQGRPSQPSLGRLKDAEKSYGRSQELWKAVTAARPRDGAALRGYSSAAAKAGELEAWTDRRDQAMATYARASELADRAIQANPNDRDSLFIAATIWFRQADQLRHSDKPEEAAEKFGRSLESFRKLEALAPAPRNRNGVALTLGRLAGVHFQLDQQGDAKRLYEEGVAIARQLSREHPHQIGFANGYATLLGEYASILGLPELTNLGETAAAERYFRELVEVRERLSERDPASVRTRHELVLHRYQLGATLLDSDPKEALRLARLAQSAVRPGEETITNTKWHVMRAEFLEARALAALGDRDGARRALERVRSKKPDADSTAITALGMATLAAEIGGAPEALLAEVEKPREGMPSLRTLRQLAEARALLARLQPKAACAHLAAEAVLWKEFLARKGPAWYAGRRTQSQCLTPGLASGAR